MLQGNVRSMQTLGPDSGTGSENSKGARANKMDNAGEVGRDTSNSPSDVTTAKNSTSQPDKHCPVCMTVHPTDVSFCKKCGSILTPMSPDQKAAVPVRSGAHANKDLSVDKVPTNTGVHFGGAANKDINTDAGVPKGLKSLYSSRSVGESAAAYMRARRSAKQLESQRAPQDYFQDVPGQMGKVGSLAENLVRNMKAAEMEEAAYETFATPSLDAVNNMAASIGYDDITQLELDTILGWLNAGETSTKAANYTGLHPSLVHEITKMAGAHDLCNWKDTF